MIELALITSTALLGVAGMAHCTAMCGAACAACTAPTAPATQTAGMGNRASSALPMAAFHIARVGSYALGGAVAAGSVAALATWSQLSPALRPFWTLLHVAALALGMYLLWRGQQPEWLGQFGRRGVGTGVGTGAVSGEGSVRPASAEAPSWQPVHFPLKAASTGALWVAWPCGLLQSALLVAAMANGPVGGAAAMAAFAVTSSGGLLLAPWAWRRWGTNPAAQTRAVRLAGALLVGAAAFALLHGLSPRFAAFCATF